MTTKANLVNPGEIREALERLRSTEDHTNWVLLGYGDGKNDIVLLGTGTGGLEEIKDYFKDDLILFAIVEVVVQGDPYNPIKRVMITWIGEQVPPGLSKARAAGHKVQLKEFVTESVSVGSEFETAKIREVSFDNIAQALTRIRPVYAGAGEASGENKTMAHSTGIHGTQSRLVVVNEDVALAGLREVFDGTADWAILAYVEGKKDEVEFVQSGKGGLDSLKRIFPTDRIYYAMFTLKVPTTGRESITKYLLLSLVGSQVKPLQKARSGGQRQEIQEFIKRVLPINAHYQPGGPADLTTEALLVKFA